MDYSRINCRNNDLEEYLKKMSSQIHFNNPGASNNMFYNECALIYKIPTILIRTESMVEFSNDLLCGLFGYEIGERLEWRKLFSKETCSLLDHIIQSEKGINGSIYEVFIIDKQGNMKKSSAKISVNMDGDCKICFMPAEYDYLAYCGYISNIEKAISKVSLQFVNSDISDTDININLALKIIGKAIEANHAYIFLFDDNGKSLSLSFEWCGKEAEPLIAEYRHIEIEKVSHELDILKRNEVILINDKDNFNQESAISKRIMSGKDIKSAILVPMIYQKNLIGYLGFNSKYMKTWNPGDLYLLKSGGIIFINYLERYKLMEAIKNKQEEINRGEERYYQLFDNIKSGVFVLEPGKSGKVFIIKDLNKTAMRIGKCTYLQVLNKDLSAIFPALLKTPIIDKLRRVWKTGKSITCKSYYYEGDSFKGWLDGYIYKLPSGEMSLVFSDVSEEFMTNRALKESQRRLLTLMSNLQGMVYRCSSYPNEWSMEFVSNGCEDLTGYGPEEITDSSFSYKNIVHPEDLKTISAKINSAIAKGEHFEIIYRIITRDKKIKWVLEKGTVVGINDGVPILEGFISDINDLVLAEEATYENQAKFITLFQSTTDAVLLQRINTEGKTCEFIEFNDTACKLFGYSHEELVNMSLEDISAPECRGKLTGLGFQIREKKHITMDFDILKKDGSRIYAEISFHHLELHGEELFLSIARDITDRKLAEITINESKNRIKKLHEIALRMEKTKVEEEIYNLIIEASQSILKLEFYTLDIAEGDYFITKAVSKGLPETAKLPTPINSGIPGKTFSEGKTIVINDITKNETARPKSSKYKSALSLPIGKYGVFQTASVNINNFSEEDIELLEILLSHATEAINRIKTEDKIKHITFHDSLTGLYNRAFFEEELKRLDVSRQLPFTIIMGDVNGLKLTNDTFGHHKGDMLLKKVADSLKASCRVEDVIARWGGDEFIIFLYKTDHKEAEKIVKRIKEGFLKDKSGPVPISVSLGIATKNDSSIETNEILRKAEERMYRNKLLESSSTRNAIIASLQKTLLEKSYETEEHTKRMQILAADFGNFLSLNESTLNELILLATLHDIGKISIPEKIILKESKLTDEDWKSIKRHPEIGYRIALSSPDLAIVADGILTHHEWWNGKGYPRSLRGEEIPFVSRIIAIIDAYDTMINGRNYKEPVSQEEAIGELERFAGIQFDPELVKRFVIFIKN